MKQETFDRIRFSVARERDALTMLCEMLDRETFEKTVDLLMKSTLTITSACGSSSFATRKFAHSLCCVECPAKFIPPSDAVHGGMGALKEGNLLILVSKGGKTPFSSTSSARTV